MIRTKQDNLNLSNGANTRFDAIVPPGIVFNLSHKANYCHALFFKIGLVEAFRIRSQFTRSIGSDQEGRKLWHGPKEANRLSILVRPKSLYSGCVIIVLVQWRQLHLIKIWGNGLDSIMSRPPGWFRWIRPITYKNLRMWETQIDLDSSCRMTLKNTKVLVDQSNIWTPLCTKSQINLTRWPQIFGMKLLFVHILMETSNNDKPKHTALSLTIKLSSTRESLLATF